MCKNICFCRLSRKKLWNHSILRKKIWNHFVMCISKKNTDTSLKMQVILPLKGKVLTDIIELSGLIERKHGLKKRVVN